MSDRPGLDEKLEQLLHRELRKLPPRRAPATLESRVLDELRRRAARAWWRQSFAHWPRTARTAFLLMGGGLGWAASLAGAWAVVNLPPLQESSAPLLSWVQQAGAVTGIAGDLATSLARAVPQPLLYEIAAVGAALYVVLFALGVAAYRTLYLHSTIPGGIRP